LVRKVSGCAGPARRHSGDAPPRRSSVTPRTDRRSITPDCSSSAPWAGVALPACSWGRPVSGCSPTRGCRSSWYHPAAGNDLSLDANFGSEMTRHASCGWSKLIDTLAYRPFHGRQGRRKGTPA
jgi:hypothetical protein